MPSERGDRPPNAIEDTVRYGRLPWQVCRVRQFQQDAKHVFINVPGYRGSLTGFNQKHSRLAQLAGSRFQMASLLVSGYRQISPFWYRKNLQRYIDAFLQYALTSATSICGSRSPQLICSATSAGAGALAAVAFHYPEIRRMVLVNPSTKDIGDKAATTGISQFKGDLSIVVGAQDRRIGMPSARLLSDNAHSIRSLQVFQFSDCGHGIRDDQTVRSLQELICGLLFRGSAPTVLPTSIESMDFGRFRDRKSPLN